MSFSAIYASRYNVPQQQVLQRPSRNLKTGSLEGNSHLDSTYAALNIPEGPHIYGTGKAQESVYKVLQDPEVSGNTKTNSELELEEQNCYEACKEPLTCRPIHSIGWLQMTYICYFLSFLFWLENHTASHNIKNYAYTCCKAPLSPPF